MKDIETQVCGMARRTGATGVLGRRFARDRRGATAVEFGFVMIPFFALLFSIFENGFLLMVDNGVDQALHTAARQVMLGAVQKDTTINTANDFRDKMICTPTSFSRVLPTYVDCTQMVVDMRVGTDFASTTPSNVFYNSATKYCTGSPGSIVMVSIMYPMPSYFPILTGIWAVANGVSTSGLALYNGSMKHLVVATAVFQNEPFDTTGWTGPKPGC